MILNACFLLVYSCSCAILIELSTVFCQLLFSSCFSKVSVTIASSINTGCCCQHFLGLSGAVVPRTIRCCNLVVAPSAGSWTPAAASYLQLIYSSHDSNSPACYYCSQPCLACHRTCSASPSSSRDCPGHFESVLRPSDSDYFGLIVGPVDPWNVSFSALIIIQPKMINHWSLF